MPKTAKKLATKKSAKPSTSAYSDARCKFQFSDKRACAMPRWKGHASFCLFHARQEQQLLYADRFGSELASLSTEFRTASGLNCALGKVFTAVAKNRIPPRNAAVLAYIGQLLMQTLRGVESEIRDQDGDERWEKAVRHALDVVDPLDEDEEEKSEADKPATPAEGQKAITQGAGENVPAKQEAAANAV